MRYIISLIAIIAVAGILYANSRHQHQTRHKHEIGTARLFIDGDELTNTTLDLTGGTLSEADFNALKSHLDNASNRHLHKHSHSHSDNHNNVVSQNRFANFVKNARNWCDIAEMLLPDVSSGEPGSVVRERVENNRNRLNEGDSQYGTFAYFKGRLTDLDPTADSLAEMVRDWVVSALQKCIDYEGHEDHMDTVFVGSPNHDFHYNGSVHMHKYPKFWAAE